MRRFSRALVAVFVALFLFGVLMGMINANAPLAVVCGIFSCVAGFMYWLLGRPWLQEGL